jgi:hypothetical protein
MPIGPPDNPSKGILISCYRLQSRGLAPLIPGSVVLQSHCPRPKIVALGTKYTHNLSRKQYTPTVTFS